MKAKILVLFSIFLMVFSCKGKDGNSSSEVVLKSEIQNYKEIKFTVKSDYKEGTENSLDLSFNDFLFRINLIDERAYLKADYKNKTVKDFQPVIYNYTYDSDFLNAEKRIKILFNGKDGYLFLPSYTEEFENFNVYKFDQENLSFYQTLALENLQCRDWVLEAENKSEIVFFVTDKATKTRCNFTKQEPYPVSDANEKQNIEPLKNHNTSANIYGKVLDEFVSDLNSDGKKDKIVVYQNEDGKDEFEKEHFNLILKVVLSGNGSSMTEKSNSQLIFPSQSNCVSEGFSNIVSKGNYFTIEQQTCYDYNIIVDSYSTFKVIGSEIYLYKYGETYFDKSNHEKKIPEKIWDEKKIGKVKFEEVDSKFLMNLRNKK
ncbi:hypothetical protein CHRY9390_00592 [Chryseobacterium aquaeductus]|uniref:YARHG domain-containing protein n=1 Tax=Chryseobacterium aquaeductus TaxID=2675056 RepID=A0A9N8MEV0_9FLAO|nr:hypothetical protein [Chryseobacterium aquaeductus]CAA7329943.1 hypothetical protein CHRY9390_00592 [Chryseobacterium potabilaquae]CAD7800173.1 hypothetical protein CHRY9390_00592 [Chryseobacterium aquaeductus]